MSAGNILTTQGCSLMFHVYREDTCYSVTLKTNIYIKLTMKILEPYVKYKIIIRTLKQRIAADLMP